MKIVLLKICKSLFKLSLTLLFLSFFLLLLSFNSSSASETYASSTNNKKIEDKEIDTGPHGHEKWVEEDDEQFYKFETHPVTPKEGITTGVVIYFGHYIRPPYNVEVRGEGWEAAVYINGLQVQPPPKDMINKLDQRLDRMMERSYKDSGISLSDEQKENINIAHKVLMEVDKYYRDLLRKYKLSEEGKKQIYAELKKYLSNHPSIDHYRLKSVFNFSYHVKGLPIFDWENYTVDNPEELLKSDEEKKAERLKKHVYYTKVAADNIIFSLQNSGCIYLCQNYSDLWLDELKQVSKILDSSLNKKEKIMKIENIVTSLVSAKYLYYNFDNKQFKADYGIEE